MLEESVVGCVASCCTVKRSSGRIVQVCVSGCETSVSIPESQRAARRRLHILKCSCLRSINGSLSPDSTTDHQWLLKINQKDVSWYFCFYKCWKTKSLWNWLCWQVGAHPNLITSRYKWTKNWGFNVSKQSKQQNRGWCHVAASIFYVQSVV